MLDESVQSQLIAALGTASFVTFCGLQVIYLSFLTLI